MWANMYCTFRIDGGHRSSLDRIDLDTDGATSKVTGVVDLARWPEQTLRRRVAGAVRTREGDLVRRSRTSPLSGEGEFRGTFNLFKGGRDLTGTFRSEEAGLNAFRFPNLAGTLRWLPDRFEVTDASSGFYGGRRDVRPTRWRPSASRTPAIATFDATYEDVDLLAVHRLHRAARACGSRAAISGRNLLAWPLGSFADRTRRGAAHRHRRPPACR